MFLAPPTPSHIFEISIFPLMHQEEHEEHTQAEIHPSPAIEYSKDDEKRPKHINPHHFSFQNTHNVFRRFV